MLLMIVLALLALTAIVGSIVALPKDGYHRAPTDWSRILWPGAGGQAVTRR